jgi:phosphatidylserine/phosphatidylglycerophosphate/cardiolipin synthase-like enzyme
MKSVSSIILVLALLVGVSGQEKVPRAAPVPRLYFSPKGGCTQALVTAIKGARKSIHVMIYQLTSEDIVAALVAAHKRGVKVGIIVDKSMLKSRRSPLEKLEEEGVPFWVDFRHAIFHHKVTVIDERLVLTGSFNYSAAAETRNAENLLLLEDETLARQYIKEWEKHRAHVKEK